jgi:hypothetical protein
VSWGADLVLDPDDDVAELVRAATGGGPDVVFEAAGVQAAMNVALGAVRPAGRVVSVAVWESPTLVDCNKLLAKEIVLMGTQAYAGEYPKVLKAIADDRIRGIERMVTARVPLSAAVDAGFRHLIEQLITVNSPSPSSRTERRSSASTRPTRRRSTEPLSSELPLLTCGPGAARSPDPNGVVRVRYGALDGWLYIANERGARFA